MGIKKKFWKIGLGIAGWCAVIACMATTTFSWFASTNNVNPGTTVSTKAVSTSAKVYQNNSHDNDDPYSKTPTGDSASTLSYDHSKGGRAVDFFIEMGTKTIQMYENVNNSGDQAAYFNINFTSAWHIKSANGTVYDYDDLHSSCPSYSSFNSSAGDISSASSYFDVYLNNDTPTAHIWITEHYEVTVSDEMGEHTGYYIIGDSDDPDSSFYQCDNQVDEEHAKPMYVNAAKNTSDKAFITGLRLSAGDSISVISGDTLAKYETPEPEEDPLNPTNLLNISSYFTDDSHGVFTCHNLGYYSIALNENSRLYVSEWDGYEVDGTTSYVAKDAGDNVLNAHPTSPSGIGAPTAKGAPSRGNKTGSIHSGQKFYLDCSVATDWDYSHVNLYFFNATENSWATDITANNSKTIYEFTAPGTNKDWTGVIAARKGETISSFTGLWHQTSNFDIYQCNTSGVSGNYGTVSNVIKPTNQNDNDRTHCTVEGYYKDDSGPYNIVGTGAWGPFSDQTCLKKNIGTTAQSITFSAGDAFKIVDVYNNPLYYGFTEKGTISTSTTGAITADGDDNFYVNYAGTYTVTKTAGNKINISGGPSMVRLSFGFCTSTGSIVSGGTPAAYIDLVSGTTATLPASLGTAPAHYKFSTDSTYKNKWFTSTGLTTGIALSGTSETISTATTYYAVVQALPSCTVTYKKVVDGVETETIATDSGFYQGEAKALRASPGAMAGYTLINGWCNASNSGSAAYSFGANYTPNSASKTFYAIYSQKTYDYYIYGIVDGSAGNWSETGSSTSGQLHQTALYTATTVSWTHHFAVGDLWRIYRPTFPSGDTPAVWYGTNLVSNSYMVDRESDVDQKHNVYVKFAGDYTITLTLGTGAISVTRVSLDAANFPIKSWNGSSESVTTGGNGTLVDDTEATYTYTGVTFTRNGRYFVRGPGAENYYAWGYHQIETSAMKDYFTEDTGYDADYSDGAVIRPMKAKASFTADVTFDFDTNTISLSNFELTSNFYIYEDSNGDGSGYSSIKTGVVSAGTTVTFANVSLTTGGNWYIACDGSNFQAGMANMPANISMLGTSATTSNYFYRSTTTGADNIATGWGGTYTIVCNGGTGAITSVSCTALNKNDMIIVRLRTNGVTPTPTTTERTTSFDSISSNVWTCSTFTHLYLGESLYLKNDNTTTLYGGGSATHIYKTNNGLSITYASGLAKYFKVVNNMLKARVDVSIKFTFTLDKTNHNGTLHITHATENTNVSFNHARTAGVYIEFANNSSFNNSDFILMHTTSGVDAGGNPYKAQEAPVYTTASTTYMRIVETHSNGTNTTPSGESAIRAATESYYYTQVSAHAGFTDNTGYIAVAVTGAFTISLQSNNLVKIENFSGAATSSVEHTVPYYLIGRGMPGSALRDNDFTISGGEQLHTYGGNSSTVPCYVGAYGTNTDPSTYVGTGIALKKGDTFALSSTAGLLTTFAATTSDVTVNNTTHIVTVNNTGTYQIYLTGSVGSETIHIVKASSGSNWTRDGSQVGGFTVVESGGTSLSFGGNLDVSLLDACVSNGYSFVVELSHESTISGTMTYTVTNGNTYAITVDKSDNTYADNLSYTGSQSIAASRTNETPITRSVSSGTTKTCIRITLSPEVVAAMLASGTYTCTLTISCQFTEDAVS